MQSTIREEREKERESQQIRTIDIRWTKAIME
jgi:hypothetical protein